MASSDEMRAAYPEPVIGRTAQGHPICDHSMGVRVSFPTTLLASGEILLLAHPAQVEAWTAFAAVMRHVGYVIREGASGIANCRNIESEPFGDVSLHAHLSAIDLNPSKNEKTNTDQPVALQTALAGIRTNRGDTVFRNLSNDRMHWQINCSRASLAEGIDPKSLPAEASLLPGSPFAQPVIEEEAMDEATWKRAQAALQALKPPLYKDKVVDGFPGPDTHRSVRAFERRMGLTERGVIGPLREPESGMWPATRELLFVTAIRNREN
jgi:hypothetical protein